MGYVNTLYFYSVFHSTFHCIILFILSQSCEVYRCSDIVFYCEENKLLPKAAEPGLESNPMSWAISIEPYRLPL